MSLDLIQLVDAVKDAMNAADPGTFSQAFTAERSYLPSHELADGSGLTVLVAPRTLEGEDDTRRDVRETIEIDIGILDKLPTPYTAKADELMTFAKEVRAFWRRLRPTTMQSAVCIKIDNNPVYSRAHIRRFQQFTSVITLTFATETEI